MRSIRRFGPVILGVLFPVLVQAQGGRFAFTADVQYRGVAKKEFKGVGTGAIDIAVAPQEGRFKVEADMQLDDPQDGSTYHIQARAKYWLSRFTIHILAEDDRLKGTDLEPHTERILKTLPFFHLVRTELKGTATEQEYMVRGSQVVLKYVKVGPLWEATLLEVGKPLAKFFLKPDEGGLPRLDRCYVVLPEEKLNISFLFKG